MLYRVRVIVADGGEAAGALSMVAGNVVQQTAKTARQYAAHCNFRGISCVRRINVASWVQTFNPITKTARSINLGHLLRRTSSNIF